MIIEIEDNEDDNAALKKAAKKVIADYAHLDFDGELEMSEIEGHYTPWRVAYVQNEHGKIEKLSIAQFWT